MTAKQIMEEQSRQIDAAHRIISLAEIRGRDLSKRQLRRFDAHLRHAENCNAALKRMCELEAKANAK